MASAFQIRHAASVIRRGGIIVYPTDTIYGLGCDPFNRAAVESIDRLKQRPANKSMILLATDTRQLQGIIEDTVPSDFKWRTAIPTTWIMPAHPNCPRWLVHTDNTIAVRITDHNLVSQMCGHLRSPIISTSANLSGMLPAYDRLSIHRIFSGKVHAMLFSDDQATGTPSTIRHYSDRTIIRP